MTNAHNRVVVSDPSRIVTHSRFGIWDYYEELDPDEDRISILKQTLHGVRELLDSTPYLFRAVKDVLAIPGCHTQVALYGVSACAGALIPAISIWYVSDQRFIPLY